MRDREPRRPRRAGERRDELRYSDAAMERLVCLWNKQESHSNAFSNASGTCFGTPSPFFARYASSPFSTLTIANAYAAANCPRVMGYSRPFITTSRLRFTPPSCPHISLASSSVISI